MRFAPTYWTNPPRSFYHGSFLAPVPGWGANAAVVGPPRLGIGQDKLAMPATAFDLQKVREATTQKRLEEKKDFESAIGGIPWWYYIAGAVMITAVGTIAYQKGWIGA